MIIRALRRLLNRLRAVGAGAHDERELDLQVADHLQRLSQHFEQQGMPPDPARSAARRQFGNVARLREDWRSLRRASWPEALWIDVRQAARALRKRPTFTLAIITILALAIGANTAIFSLCNTVLIRPLPYLDPDRLVTLWEQRPSDPLGTVAPANFVDWRRETRSFAGMAAMTSSSLVLTGAGDAMRWSIGRVSWNFFTVLGVQPVIGRSFTQDEDHPGRSTVVILSYATWTSRFGGKPDVVGSTVTLDDTPYTVIGVLPSSFAFINKAARVGTSPVYEAWVPLALDPARLPRGTHPLRVYARLASEVSLDQAQAELDVLAARLATAYPDANRDKGIRAVTLDEWLTGDARRPLLTLLAAVGFVLLIACANIANLLLARAAERRRETAVRLALGSSIGRVARSVLIESGLLGFIGGGLGVALAVISLSACAPYLPPDLPQASSVSVDWRVVAFAAAVSLGTVLLFALLPVLQLQRVNPRETLAHGTRVASSPMMLRAGFVVIQVAMALVLLVGTGLLTKSLWTLTQVPTGFRSDHVLTVRVTLPRARYTDAARVAAFQQLLLQRLRAIPAIASAGATAYLPMSGDDNGWAFFIEGRPPLPVGVFNMAKYRAISDGYFGALGLPLLRGRDIRASDTRDAPPVVVINDAMAKRHWPGEEPLGQRLTFAGVPRTIIGIVSDVRHEGLAGDLKPEMYVPFAQAPNVETIPTLVVQTTEDPLAVVSAVHAAVVETDPEVPVDRVKPLDAFVTESTGLPRFRTRLLAGLALLALGMASVGLYGVTNHAVVQRTREFGIYLAVGAAPADVMWLVLANAARTLGIGVVVGLIIAVVLSRSMSGLLYEVSPLDAATFVTVPLILVVVGLVAGFMPARRASRIDPMLALRAE